MSILLAHFTVEWVTIGFNIDANYLILSKLLSLQGIIFYRQLSDYPFIFFEKLENLIFISN
jgi:hypothetical protein